MIKPSHGHKNRLSHNWIVYQNIDQCLFRNEHLLKGALYDLGCGDGTYKSYFIKFASSYVGVDWVKTIHTNNADINTNLNEPLPIETGVADTVVSISVLEHLYAPQVMLGEAYRILSPMGNLILQVPWQWWLHEEPHDYFRFTPYGLEFMLRNAGFSDIVIEPTSGFFTMWFLKFNYFTMRFVKGPRLLRGIMRLIFTPLWYLLQMMAPSLDKLLDKRWAAESQSYFVIARKGK